jgi:hypothetical protein
LEVYNQTLTLIIHDIVSESLVVLYTIYDHHGDGLKKRVGCAKWGAKEKEQLYLLPRHFTMWSFNPEQTGQGISTAFQSIQGYQCQRIHMQVAMYEHLADMFGGPPNSNHFSLYSRWARHGWGMVLTGNVQVSPLHLSLGRDMVIPDSISEESLRPFQQLAQIIHQGRVHSDGSANTSTGPLAIMQLSHAGRQSPNILGGRSPFAPPLSSSPIALGSGNKGRGFMSGLIYRLLFQVPQEMSLANIDDVVEAFTRGAKLAALAGFDGIQLHAAHGCGYLPLYMRLSECG